MPDMDLSLQFASAHIRQLSFDTHTQFDIEGVITFEARWPQAAPYMYFKIEGRLLWAR